MSREVFQRIAQREIVESLDFATQLSDQIRHVRISSLISKEAYQISTLCLMDMLLPESDEQFLQEIESAKRIVKVGTGEFRGFGGSTREIVEQREQYDTRQIFRACLKLMRRLGLLLHENQKAVWG